MCVYFLINKLFNMNFWDKLENLGGGVIEYAGSIFETGARNSKAESTENEALAERLKINNQIALQNAENEAQRAERNAELIKNVVYVVLFIVAISVIFVLVRPMLKK